MKPSERLRLFFALWPDEPVRAAIARKTEALAVSLGGRRVPPANLHVTLAFLGDVAADRLERIEASAERVRLEPFAIALSRLDLWGRARVLVLQDPEPPAGLFDVVAQLQRSLRVAGLDLEDRPYRMHVTLARNVPRGLSLVETATAIEPIAWPVRSFVLIQSRVSQAGSEYGVLKEWKAQ